MAIPRPCPASKRHRHEHDEGGYDERQGVAGAEVSWIDVQQVVAEQSFGRYVEVGKDPVRVVDRGVGIGVADGDPAHVIVVNGNINIDLNETEMVQQTKEVFVPALTSILNHTVVRDFSNCKPVPCECWKDGCALYCMTCEDKGASS